MSENCNCEHDHDEACDCDLGEGIITLVDEEGIEHEFEIADMLDEDGVQYLALIPVIEDPDELLNDPGELVVLKVVAQGAEEFLEAIEDEDEFNRISALFMDRLGEDYDFIEEE